MTKRFCCALGLGATLLYGQADPQPLFENYGNWSYDPPLQIDAIAFANYGTFQVVNNYGYINGSTLFPYDFSNTRYFTNSGTMTAYPGFEFDTVADSGDRQPAVHFINTGLVEGLPDPFTGNSFVLVSAQNVVNPGTLSVTDGGWLRVAGDRVNLARGSLDVATSAGAGYGDQVVSNTFWPDIGISDIWWGGLTNARLDVAQFIGSDPVGGPWLSTPNYRVTNAAGGVGFDSFLLLNPAAGMYTNVIQAGTNQSIIVQAALVGYDTNLLTSRVRFSDAVFSDSDSLPVVVELAMSRTNSVTGIVSQETLYITDYLAASTNQLFLQNRTTVTTFRPANFFVSRIPPIEFYLSEAGNTPFTTNVFFDPTYVIQDQPITNLWSAYAFGVSLVSGGIPPLPGAVVTNLPGRVTIDAGQLDLTDTRVRANSTIELVADHLVSNNGARVDAPNLVFNLASTNGPLHIADMGGAVMTLFEGAIRMYSTIWTNQSEVLETNVAPDPSDPNLMVTNIVTNVFNVHFHVLAVDAYSMGSTQQVQVHGLTLKGGEVVVDDDYVLVGSTLLDAQTLTLNGDLTYSGGTGNLGATNAPRLLRLTNNGALTVGNTLYLGSDRQTPYERVVNYGDIAAAGMRVRSAYFQNSGQLTIGNSLRVDGGTAKLENGSAQVGVETMLSLQDLKMHQYTNRSAGALVLTATNSLSDSGGSAANRIEVGRGFQSLRKPLYGDILGTELVTSASPGAWVDHVWSAEDRGAAPGGFTNNAAIGRLTLSAAQGGQLWFHGGQVTGAKAIYVDYLNLQGNVLDAYNRGQLTNYLKLDPGLTLYFAGANVIADDLNGELNGQLRWVKEFVGPNSSMEIALASGRTIRVNRALRESLEIDSDGDGLANGQDTVPFGGPVMMASVAAASPNRAVIQWTAAARTTYAVEFTTDLAAGTWTVLGTVSNPEASRRQVQFDDAIPSGNAVRYYRVRYTP